jgi:large subunit ribosomal protein L15
MPIQRRLPKRGFKNPFRKVYHVINVEDLNQFEPDSQLDPETLKAAGLAKQKADGIKLLGNGEITKAFVVKVHKASRTAREKIEAAGGRIEIL